MTTQDMEKRVRERGTLLLSLLRHGKRRHMRRVLFWGGLRLLGLGLLGAMLLVLLAALTPILPRPVGIALSLLAWAGFGWLLWDAWIRPLRAVPNLAVFSKLVEERRDFRDLLRAALEFSQRGTPAGGSSDLVGATIDRAYDEARSLDLERLFDFPHKRRYAAMLTTGILCIALWTWLAPAAPQRALQALAFGYPSPASIVYGNLSVEGGNIDVLAGQDVVVRVVDEGPLAPEMLLRFNDTGDLWKTRSLQPTGDRTTHVYDYRFENIRDHTAYRFESGKRRTDDFRIRVIQRPIVNRFSLRLVPPEYTQRPPQTLEDGRGDAIALVGTRIEVAGTASTSLARARIVPEDDPSAAVTLPGPLSMELDGAGFAGSFVLHGNLRYQFQVEDSLGNRNADPVTYQISAIEDRPPFVELRSPEPDAIIPKSLQVDLLIQASDDFGISRMTLVARRERPDEESQEPEKRTRLKLHDGTAVDPEGKVLGADPAPELLKTHAWDLGSMQLFPGDLVSYYIEVEDNDEFSGHKKARTPTYTLRLPTLGELYAEIRDEDENRMTELDDVIEKGRELQEKYERMARELKKNPEVDWQKEEEIKKALEKQKELAEKIEDIAQDLQEQMDKMEEQELVSAEIAEKMEQISKLLEEVEDDTLREYMEKLQEAMEKLSPEEIQRAMENMELSQEEFLQRLERTKALLEQLQREQKLDALVERTGELLERQEELTDRTQELQEKMQQGDESEQGDGKDSPEQQEGEREGEKSEGEKQESENLSREQEQLSEDTSQLEKELQELIEKMQEAGRQELNDAEQEMQEQKPSEEMREASKNLQQQQPQQAQPSQQEAERRLRALYEMLMNAQMAMSQNMDLEAMLALQKAARQSLDVSFRQEHLTREPVPPGDRDRNVEIARDQQALRAATGKVAEGLDEVGKKSLAVPQNVLALLSQAMGKMTQGVDAYEKGNPLAGRLHGEDAFADLNRAVVELNRSAKACSGGSGSPSSRQQMSGLMGRQQQLNDATRRLQEALQNGHGLSPEQRAQMSRLLAEQRAIQGELQDVDRQAREQKDLLGRMDRMLEEMREVVEDMESEAVSEETLDLQERIVSRMLDASRSLHKRDYNKQRESRSVADVFSEGGSELTEDEVQKKLRRDILRALESGTPEEYQELVRQYFRAIAEAEERELP